MEAFWRMVRDHSVEVGDFGNTRHAVETITLGHGMGESPFRKRADRQSKLIPALSTWREALFAGFFGPIGKPSSTTCYDQKLKP